MTETLEQAAQREYATRRQPPADARLESEDGGIADITPPPWKAAA